VSAASGLGQKAFTWIRELEDNTLTFEYFADSGPLFCSLDDKILAAVCALATGELGREITDESEKLAQQGIQIRGRQVAWIVYAHFRTKRAGNAMHAYRQLWALKFKGQGVQAIETFHRNWDHVMIHLGCKLDDDIVQECYESNISKSDEFKWDWKIYDKFDEDGPERMPPAGYAWLRKMADKIVDKDREDKLDKELEQALGGNVNAAAGQPDGKGRGRSRNRKGQSAGAGGDRNKSRDKSSKGKGKGKDRRTQSAGPALDGRDKKTVPCPYNTEGKCKKGNKCDYLHEPRRGRSPKNTAPAASAAITGVCKEYRQGRCLKGGRECDNKHEGPQDLKRDWEAAHPAAAAQTVKARANRKKSKERAAAAAKPGKAGKSPAATPPPAKSGRRRRSKSANK
jgi:hypothetical protein